MIPTLKFNSFNGGLNKTGPICVEGSGKDLTLFLTIPANKKGFRECRRLLFPSLALFWPFRYQKLKMVIVLDGDIPGALYYGNLIRQEAATSLPNSSDIFVEHDFSNISNRFPSGWHRQQWLMFWADNFTSSEYVGFVDSDTIFTSRILPSDLFDGNNGKPIVRGLFGKVLDSYEHLPVASHKAVGHPEPFNCMTYFPVIIETKDLKPIRQRMMEQFDNSKHFDLAYEKLMKFQASFSQFCIMCDYLFNYRQNQYQWSLYERRPGDWSGPFLDSQTGLSDEIKPFLDKTKWRPGISAHWPYEKYEDEIKFLDQILRTGICYSWPHVFYDLCDDVTGDIRLNHINKYEWHFEGHNWARADPKMALEAHRKRINELLRCPQTMDPLSLEIVDNLMI